MSRLNNYEFVWKAAAFEKRQERLELFEWNGYYVVEWCEFRLTCRRRS